MISPEKLHFVTAGIPITTKKGGYLEGLQHNLENDLLGMEMEFVRGVRMSTKNIVPIKDFIKKNGMILSAHAPFYINLNAKEEDKYEASIQRILDSARMTYACGGYSVTFHAAYYLKQNPELVYNTVKKALKRIVQTLKDDNISIWIRPELTGKATQFGSLDELIKLSNDLEMVLPCIDFSHQHARLNGFNGYENFCYILEKLKSEIGPHSLSHFHGHVAGIEYSAKGERRHLNLNDSDFKYKELLQALKYYNVKGTLVCECPNIEGDTILLADYYKSLSSSREASSSSSATITTT